MDNQKLNVHHSVLLAAKTEDLKFVFSQAKDNLKEVSDEGDRLYTKSLTFISVCITLILASGSYIFLQKTITPLSLSSASVLVIFWVVLSRLKNNIFPTQYYVPGSSPEKLLVSTFFEPVDGFEEKSAEWFLLYNEIYNYYDRIKFNKEANEIRKTRLINAYKLVFFAPIVFVLSYLLGSLASLLYVSLL